jgi:hypothetical protein
LEQTKEILKKKKNRACELLWYKKKKENVYQNGLLRMKRDGESENGRSDWKKKKQRDEEGEIMGN